jgi:hypothetical protein
MFKADRFVQMENFRDENMKDNSKPAYPPRGGMFFYVPKEHEEQIEAALAKMERNYDGLTKREYAAIMAMQGLIASPRKPSGADGDVTVDHVSSAAVAMADALLLALDERKE